MGKILLLSCAIYYWCVIASFYPPNPLLLALSWQISKSNPIHWNFQQMISIVETISERGRLTWIQIYIKAGQRSFKMILVALRRGKLRDHVQINSIHLQCRFAVNLWFCTHKCYALKLKPNYLLTCINTYKRSSSLVNQKQALESLCRPVRKLSSNHKFKL